MEGNVLDPRREGDVTASDVPAICGECPYQTRRAVLYKKALRLRSVDNPTTLHGRVHEPIALRKFCEHTGAEVVEYPCGYKKHATYKWLGGTMDAIVKMPTGETIVVEIKCPPKRTIKDEVPVHYLGQVQTYLFIEGEAPYALFVQYKPAGPRSKEKLQITRVERDPGYMALRLPSLKRFWDELQLWTAYTDRIVTVIQRAWRCYRSRKDTEAAAMESMRARLKCAKIVGKMAGFCKTRDAQQGMLVPPSTMDGQISYVESEDLAARRNFEQPPPEAKRPRRGGPYLVLFEDE